MKTFKSNTNCHYWTKRIYQAKTAKVYGGILAAPLNFLFSYLIVDRFTDNYIIWIVLSIVLSMFWFYLFLSLGKVSLKRDELVVKQIEIDNQRISLFLFDEREIELTSDMNFEEGEIIKKNAVYFKALKLMLSGELMAWIILEDWDDEVVEQMKQVVQG